jgi:hypothetical protein
MSLGGGIVLENECSEVRERWERSEKKESVRISWY